MRQDESPEGQRFRLQHVAFFGRTFAEYLQMFALDLESLRGARVLDVASGPGSFVAEALARGLDATGCDPMYAESRYVPGALPSLPLEDRAFDLVLSANFLGTPTRRSSPGALPAGRRRGSARRGARRVRKRRGVLRRSLAAAPRLPYIRRRHEPGSPR